MIFLENFKTPLNFYIPNEEGLRLMKEALNKSQNKNMFIESLIELAELVLKDKYFKSNDRLRNKKAGTALGTKFVPLYAIIFIAALEG